jgi:ribosomal RNA assembly protein
LKFLNVYSINYIGDYILEVLLIPKERTGVLKEKEIKETIEKVLDVKISFKENLVEIDGEGLKLYRAKDIVKAIGRGFAPNKAFRLFDEEQVLEIIDLGDHSDKKKRTIKARLIGTKGKTRKKIEYFSRCSVSICGDTICLIGKHGQIKVAEEAVKRIIRGSKHTKVYAYLRDVKIDE